MTTNHELIMYSRSVGCPTVAIARRVLNEHAIPYREIHIDKDPAALDRVLAWTGFKAVPTLVIAPAGSVLPVEEPEPLPPGASPRGIDRGYMLTEPGTVQLEDWLTRHQLIGQPGRG
jgi:glutaredoxin